MIDHPFFTRTIYCRARVKRGRAILSSQCELVQSDGLQVSVTKELIMLISSLVAVKLLKVYSPDGSSEEHGIHG